MSIPVYDRSWLFRQRQAEIEKAVVDVLRGDIDLENEITAFEEEFAAWNAASHAISVHSGTAAIRISLLGLGIGPGDEVITVPNTDIATSSAIRQTGAALVWTDVDPLTRTMDLDALERAITPRTRAVVPVDMYGHPARMAEITALAAERRIAVVEDACLALGATISGRKVGSFATATCFSFGRNKHLGAIGSGGCILTEDADLAERLRKLSGYGETRARSASKTRLGQEGWFWHETDGTNQRLDEIQAAILRIKLKDIDANLAARRRQAERYARELAGTVIETPRCLADVEHAWRNYVVEADNRDAVRAHLAARGIGTNMCYVPSLNLQPAFADMRRDKGSFPVVERICDRLFGLPIGPQLSDEEQAQVIEALKSAV